jgi:hypothetical protein
MNNRALHSSYVNVEIVKLNPSTELRDYRDAIHMSNRVADNKLGAYMLLSWYDRDRDFESPQHSSGCHSENAIPGYVDYGLHHGATLKVDIEDGRFVFFYLPTDL